MIASIRFALDNEIYVDPDNDYRCIFMNIEKPEIFGEEQFLLVKKRAAAIFYYWYLDQKEDKELENDLLKCMSVTRKTMYDIGRAQETPFTSYRVYECNKLYSEFMTLQSCDHKQMVNVLYSYYLSRYSITDILPSNARIQLYVKDDKFSWKLHYLGDSSTKRIPLVEFKIEKFLNL